MDYLLHFASHSLFLQVLLKNHKHVVNLLAASAASWACNARYRRRCADMWQLSEQQLCFFCWLLPAKLDEASPVRCLMTTLPVLLKAHKQQMNLLVASVKNRLRCSCGLRLLAEIS